MPSGLARAICSREALRLEHDSLRTGETYVGRVDQTLHLLFSLKEVSCRKGRQALHSLVAALPRCQVCGLGDGPFWPTAKDLAKGQIIGIGVEFSPCGQDDLVAQRSLEQFDAPVPAE